MDKIVKLMKFMTVIITDTYKIFFTVYVFYSKSI